MKTDERDKEREEQFQKKLTDLEMHEAELKLKLEKRDVILNERITEMKKAETRAAKDRSNRYHATVENLTKENQNLAGRLKKAKDELSILRRELLNHERDKMNLQLAEARVKFLTKADAVHKVENGVLKEQLNNALGRRDDMYNGFIKCIREIQQRIELKRILLEKKLSTALAALEHREAILGEIVSIGLVHEKELPGMAEKLKRCLNGKDNEISSLREVFAKHCKFFSIKCQKSDLFSEAFEADIFALLLKVDELTDEEMLTMICLCTVTVYVLYTARNAEIHLPDEEK